MLLSMEGITSLPTVTAICVAFILSYLVYFVRLVKSYPRGPLPLPILGNVLHFRGSYHDTFMVFRLTEWGKKYGPMYTVWIGHTPLIVVNSFELHNEAAVLRRNDFIERRDFKFHEIFRWNSQNVFSTSGPYWEALRKVAVFAVRRFMNSSTLSGVACDVTDEAIDLIKAKQNNKEFDPECYIDYIIYNILASVAFGETQKFASMDSKELKDAKLLKDDFYRLNGNGLLSDFIPWLRPFYYQREVQMKETIEKSCGNTKQMFNERKQTFQQGTARHFSDCVLEAKEEAIRENFSRSKFLNDDNLYMIVSDLFIAGTDTTHNTLRWSLLILGNDPQLQEEIYQEIDENLNGRIATQEDKNLLPLTSAFLLEVLRFRPPVPLGLDHSTGVDTELGGHKLPKDTFVMFNLYAQNNDPKYWSKPEKFNPKRFFDTNGNLMTGRIPSFVSFGLGRRACPGEKLALNNSFFVLTRILQKLKIKLSTGPGSADLHPINLLFGSLPKNYKIVCSSR